MPRQRDDARAAMDIAARTLHVTESVALNRRTVASAFLCASHSRPLHRRNGPAAAITVTGTTAIDIASDVWFWPKIAAALTSKHHWLVINCDSCGTHPRDVVADFVVACVVAHCTSPIVQEAIIGHLKWGSISVRRPLICLILFWWRSCAKEHNPEHSSASLVGTAGTMTIDIIAGETPAAQGLSTAADAFVRGASAYKTASANHIVATEIDLLSWRRQLRRPPPAISSSL